VTYKGFGGAARTIKIFYQPTLRAGYSPQTYAQLFPNLNGSSGSAYPVIGSVSAIELPDGRRYEFQYNPYGEVARVVLPTGGAIEYDYAAGVRDAYASGQVGEGNSAYHCHPTWPDPGAYDPSPRVLIYRRVTERRLYPDGVTLGKKTTYSRPERKVNSSWAIANDGYIEVDERDAGDALLARTRHFFQTGSVSYQGAGEALYYRANLWGIEGYPNLAEGREFKTEQFNTDGTAALVRAETTWAGPVINEARTTLLDTNQVSKRTFAYDSYYNQTDAYEYDYGAGAPPAYPARHRHTDYVTTYNGANYAGDNNIHLRSLPLREIVYAVNPATGAETWTAQTEYEYDKYDSSTHHAPLVSRTNISGHDAAFTTSYATRGNVTQVNRWLNSGGSSVVSSYAQYDVAGNVVKAIDARGSATTFDYRDNFGTPLDAVVQTSGNPASSAPGELAGQSAFAFPFSVTNALGHVAYSKYDYYLGRPVLSEDTNQVKSSLRYDDALDRPTKGIAAIGAGAQAQTNIFYDDASRVITVAKDRVGYGESATGGGIVSKAYYDGLGRTFRASAYDGSAWSISVTEFDALGRTKRVTNPFRATSPDSAPSSPEWTTTTYDALGRAVEVKTPDLAAVTTAYSGNRVLVTDQAGKQRISETNALGHLRNV
jgi:YD repeat-containing protein